MCGGTSKIPRVQKSISSMFPNAELLSSQNPDEVQALGAATQASLLNEPWSAGDKNDSEQTTVKPMLTATAHALQYSVMYFSHGSCDDANNDSTANDSLISGPKKMSNLTTLIPSGVPIPIRRSNHLTVLDNPAKGDGTYSKMVVTVFVTPKDGDPIELKEVSLCCAYKGSAAPPNHYSPFSPHPRSATNSAHLFQLKLDGLSNESKISVSAHIHRDGSVHFTLTDKTSGKADQLTLKAPAS